MDGDREDFLLRKINDLREQNATLAAENDRLRAERAALTKALAKAHRQIEGPEKGDEFISLARAGRSRYSAGMPRTARRAPGGYVYHVLNRGNGRAPVFDDDGDYAAFERVLAETLQRHPSVRLLAYCLMPNHWHLLLRPPRGGPAGQLGAFMQRLTVTHVRRWHAHRHSDGGGHLYQGPYKSFPVQGDRHFLVVARYVERNPLRAGLVARAQDWRWSSLSRREHGRRDRADEANEADGAAEAGNEPVALPPLADWPVERPQDWLQWVNRPQTSAEEEAVRTSIRRGRPFGADAWQRAAARATGRTDCFRDRGRPRKEKAGENGRKK